MKPAPAKTNSAKHSQAKSNFSNVENGSIVEASSATKMASLASVWISSNEADARLLSRTEPQYPPEARSAHRSGNVVLEVHVADDGSVSNIRTLSGDPVLAAAAAQAVRKWRYQPYRFHDHPAQFQTDVTLTFALPN
jgi:TonB family protein